MSNETPNPYSPSVTAPMQDPFAAFDPRASRFNRCIAAMVDGFLMMFIIFPVQIATGHLRRVMTQQATPLELFLMGTVLGVTVFLVLNGLLLAKRGQTIGKWVMGCGLSTPILKSSSHSCGLMDSVIYGRCRSSFRAFSFREPLMIRSPCLWCFSTLG